MHPKPIIIKEGAVFIADAHHSSLYHNTLDFTFTELLQSQKRQIFLLGDIFDFLVGPVSQSIQDNQKTLRLLEQLACKHEVYYLEGNHDFLLQTLPYFKNIRYFSLKEQPVACLLNNHNAYLAHGDIFLTWHYKIFSKIIRNKRLILFLNLFTAILYPKIIHFLKNKNDHRRHDSTLEEDFTNFAQLRIKNYHKAISLPKNAYIIEGHFHQGNHAKEQGIHYIGLPFFACKKKYFIVECADSCLMLKES